MTFVPPLRVLRPTRRLAPTLLLAGSLLFQPALQAAEDNALPTFGGVGGGLISGQMESEIGQQVMRSLRRSADQIQDPLVHDYLESIVYRLLPSVSLQDRSVALVVIDSPALNAFAVPGNIIGVNGGLFLNARTEQQFASVIAHELAHLSQRHFARRLEQQETSAPLTMAGMIAGIILSAVTKSDVGIAAIAGTQALAVQNMLQYSRANEQEADRVGLEVMADAGMDPRGMPEMFEIMMRQNRLQGNQVPEYLSTHPLSQSRVSDTRGRAEQYPVADVEDALEYHLVRARLQVHYARSPTDAVKAFEEYMDTDGADKVDAAKYGLAVAYLAADRAGEAEAKLRQLLDARPARITYQVTLAQALIAQSKTDEARDLLQDALRRNPGNRPITATLAETELKAGNAPRAAEHLRSLTRDYPHREDYWLKLAEAAGQARDIVAVHRARAEYEILMGDLESAERQLRQAQEKVPPDAPLRQIVTERLSQVSDALARSR
ncbi:M48 family metalloprotease [Marinobacter salicampi]|uniref:M48 family metalloprotease n=1 Tax=Marinobacter salicampi TaxID=435907 RepID=UPI00140C8EF2|nr:M48 family metalloprotease [Marinobacter salicampi]